MCFKSNLSGYTPCSEQDLAVAATQGLSALHHFWRCQMESRVSGTWWHNSDIIPSGMCSCCSWHTASYCLCFRIKLTLPTPNVLERFLFRMKSLLFLSDHIRQGLQSVINCNLTICYWMPLNCILLMNPPVCQYRIPSHFLSNCVLIKQEDFYNIIYVTYIICIQQYHFSLIFYQNLAFVHPSLLFVFSLFHFLCFMGTLFFNLDVLCAVLCCSFKTWVTLKEESWEEKIKNL